MPTKSQLILPGAVSRRDMLASTLGGFGYLAMAGLSTAASQPAPHFTPKAKRVIMLFMQGGVSHVDTFDYKPALNKHAGEAFPKARSAKILGSPWKFQKHGESGQWISSLFPHVAKQADRLCVLTAMNTDAPGHETAVPLFHCGNQVQSRPSIGAWVNYGLGSETEDLPGFIAMNPLNAFGNNNHGSSFLPASYQATFVSPGGKEGGPPIENLDASHCTPSQQATSLDLLSRVNAARLQRDGVNDDLEAVIGSYEMAFRMQSVVPELMDLNHESPSTLKAYGIGDTETDRFGRQCLFARKFAESGVRFIEIGTGGWDHHKDLHNLLPKSARSVDRPIAALIDDLHRRGMLEDTLVIWAGEFGRTPFAQFENGRDHNRQAFTIWMAGGGVKAGYRHGVTDEFGHEGVADRVHIHDLHATILHQLGLDHEKLTYRYSGRDFRLTDVHGNVVHDILA